MKRASTKNVNPNTGDSLQLNAGTGEVGEPTTDTTSAQPAVISPSDAGTGHAGEPVASTRRGGRPAGPVVAWGDEGYRLLLQAILRLKAANDGKAPTAEQVAASLSAEPHFANQAAPLTPVKVTSHLRSLAKHLAAQGKTVPTLTRKPGKGGRKGTRLDLNALGALLPDAAESEEGNA